MRQKDDWQVHRIVNPTRKACRFESYLAHQINVGVPKRQRDQTVNLQDIETPVRVRPPIPN